MFLLFTYLFLLRPKSQCMLSKTVACVNFAIRWSRELELHGVLVISQQDMNTILAIDLHNY